MSGFFEHIELYYQIVSCISAILTQLIAAVGLGIMSENFLKERKKKFLVGAAYFTAMMILYCIPLEVNNFIAYSIGVVCALLMMIYTDHGNTNIKVFIAITFFAARWIGISMASGISTFISSVISTKFLETSKIIDRQMIEKGYFLLYCSEDVLENVLNIIILYLIAFAIKRAFKDKYICINGKELCILSMPSILGMLNYVIVLNYNRIFEQATKRYIFDSHQEIQLLWSVYDILLIGAILSVIMLFQKLKQKQEQEKRQYALQRQIEDIQSHIEKVEKIYSGIRGIKHDIRNHVSILMSLMEQERYDEMTSYLESLQNAVEAYDFKIKAGNPVTDVIINEKAEEAARRNIQFESRFSFPLEAAINAFDVSIISNNALLNAIEATKEGGFITLSSFRNKNAYFITIKNSYEGKLTLDKQSELPVTSKLSKELHGFGMKNMKSVAEKYFGNIEFEQSEKEVEVKIMLIVA